MDIQCILVLPSFLLLLPSLWLDHKLLEGKKQVLIHLCVPTDLLALCLVEDYSVLNSPHNHTILGNPAWRLVSFPRKNVPHFSLTAKKQPNQCQFLQLPQSPPKHTPTVAASTFEEPSLCFFKANPSLQSSQMLLSPLFNTKEPEAYRGYMIHSKSHCCWVAVRFVHPAVFPIWVLHTILKDRWQTSGKYFNTGVKWSAVYVSIHCEPL